MNQRHADFQSAALPTELSGHSCFMGSFSLWKPGALVRPGSERGYSILFGGVKHQMTFFDAGELPIRGNGMKLNGLRVKLRWLFLVVIGFPLVVGDRDRVGAAEPAGEVDVAAAVRSRRDSARGAKGLPHSGHRRVPCATAPRLQPACFPRHGAHRLSPRASCRGH